MKKMWIILGFWVLLFSSYGTQAQIWNKIKNATEKHALNKASNKVNQQKDQAVKVNVNSEDIMGGYVQNKADVSKVPNSYVFSWKYVMEIKTDEGKAMNAAYFLEPNAGYFGFNIGQKKEESTFMIMDAHNRIMVTCFGNAKEKMASASKMPDYSEMENIESEKSKFIYKAMPNKTILGYNCKGIQAINDEYDIIFYYTNDAKVSFGDLFKNQKNKKIPDAFSNYFKPGEKPLMMDMTIKDMMNKGKVSTMRCISLDKSVFVFNKADYHFM
ncbi:Domain of unknown function DUF4412 [Flavobacteriaceae bacterium]